MSQRAALDHYKIPRLTIKNKLKNYHGKSVGHPTVFGREEELCYAQHCVTLANFGFPLIPIDLKMTICRYLDSKGTQVPQFKNNIPEDDWVNSSLKRHPEENKNCALNEDLVGQAFLDCRQKERQDFIGGPGKPRKKNCKSYQEAVFLMKTSNRHVLIPVAKNKKRCVLFFQR